MDASGPRLLRLKAAAQARAVNPAPLFSRPPCGALTLHVGDALRVGSRLLQNCVERAAVSGDRCAPLPADLAFPARFLAQVLPLGVGRGPAGMKGPRDDRRVEAALRESHALTAGRYEVLEELGDGPAGTTYKARHALLGNLLSVTVLPAALTDDPPQLALVQDAVRQACRLRHDHIVPVLDFGEEQERYYLVEAFVDAEPLDRVLRDGKPLAPSDALHVARQLADALAYAHERGVVHGALTPATVRIHREAPPRVLLSSFATVAAAARVAYSAPERLAGTRVDPRSDVFALGLLLFEMLEGKRFFRGSDEETRDVLLPGGRP